MKNNQNLLREAMVAGLAMFFVVPAVKAPAYSAASTGDNSQSVLSETQNLATPNPALQPRPLRTWECISSWYGEDFDGQPTADGELYDMYGMTAAHPTLPLGSVVRIVNLRTNLSAIVRINDRGPYVPGRDLDVSYQVARQLGFLHRGLAHVRLELLEVPTLKAKQPAN
jgi:rare lipoprotein A (peptidoglycan hydrolase)